MKKIILIAIILIAGITVKSQNCDSNYVKEALSNPVILDETVNGIHWVVTFENITNNYDPKVLYMIIYVKVKTTDSNGNEINYANIPTAFQISREDMFSITCSGLINKENIKKLEKQARKIYLKK
ncbi:MAG: hypothetical protein WC390_07250 [Sulfurimonas sp.]|jgi:hypothetical protein